MEENITEYVISLYRKEDLMRAYHFDLEKFGTQVINFFPISAKEKLAEVNHYEEFMNKMKAQGIEESGHLDEVNQIVADLEELHQDLKSTDHKYVGVYEKARGYIENNMALSEGTISSEVQICLNGIYGYLLLKIEETKISAEDQNMIETFGDLLSLLSHLYAERKKSN